MKQLYGIILLFFAGVAGLLAQEIRLTADEYFIHYLPDQNLVKLEQQLLEHPESTDLLLARARLRLLYGMDTKAMEDIETINTLNPYALYLHGFYGADGYLQVIDKEPESALIELTLAQRMEHYRDYISEEQAKGNISPLVTNALLTIVFDILGERLGTAEERVNAFIAEHSDMAIGYDLLSVILTERGDYDEATKVLSEAIALDPMYAMTWYNFGRIERINGKHTRAMEYFDAAISLRAGLSKAYFDRAMVNKELANYEEAQADYSHIIDQNEDLKTAALRNRGLARRMSGDFEGAINDLSGAIEAEPDNAALFKNRGNLYLLLGMHRRAIDDYNRALSLDAEYSEAYYNRGLTHYILGDKQKACRDLQEADRMGFEKAAEKKRLLCDPTRMK